MHVHVIPRYAGDVEESRGGVRGMIPERREY
jgi:diadenosine tetraphosphate (Ap4A) HIT family hydrolase